MSSSRFPSRSALLLLLLALASLASSSSVEPRTATHAKSRRLGRARGSARTSTANDLYNTNSARGGPTVVSVALGAAAGVATLLGLLFLVDRETFAQVAGMGGSPRCCRCAAPRVDDDEDAASEPTNFEKDAYKLSEETQAHLAEMEEGWNWKAPWHRLTALRRCCRIKERSDSDKYNVPRMSSSGAEAEAEAEDGLASRCQAWGDRVRLRLFWRPTKRYDKKDKYAVTGEGGEGAKDEEDIKYSDSSYESGEPGTVPW